MSKRIFDELISKNPTKYPARMGKAWSNEEEQQLLREVQKKIPFDMIAELHERTIGAITSHLRQIAADYYFNNEMPIDKIQQYTRLMKLVMQSLAENSKKSKKKKRKYSRNRLR